ncbi:MAG: glycerol-3-phosphate acyltransferase, partial [Clostridia bacterium]|nr:glycerol-3-phosphate acyltransferase [Clostridia bacterium]
MQYLVIISIAVISYLIGSVNFSILLSKAVSGKDIRESGSGNAGATNILRTHGKKMAIITLVLDVLKGIVAVLLAWGIAALAANLVKTMIDASSEGGIDLLDKLERHLFNPDGFTV